MSKACEELGSGSEGGGHNIAAGATIPKGFETRFIEIVERLLTKQLGRMKDATAAMDNSSRVETIK
jgi:nanoRNase/pAp phosphatase (c-di-AMP/oligoRNAs hydrolase)